MIPLLQAHNVTKTYGARRGAKANPAIKDFSLSIAGEPASITALVGESGSGKTTLAQLLLNLISPTSGEVLYRGQNLQKLTAVERRQFQRDIQIIFQDPFEVYNPFYKVDHLLTVPIKKFELGSSRQERRQLMERGLVAVGLDPGEILGRYPHQLSGGQRQRVAIARALLIQPRLIIADEPVSMVDASLRVSILENLRQLNRDFGISILYITHDLATAFQISENMIVLYRGSVAEAGDVERIVHAPQHPYTQLLIDSIPRPNPDQIWRARENGAGTAQRAISTGECKFAGQCPQVMPACRQSSPPLFQVEENRAVACYLYRDAPVLEATKMDSTFVSKAQLSLISDSNRLGGTNV